jgi:hypothetical protein
MLENIQTQFEIGDLHKNQELCSESYVMQIINRLKV